MLKSWRTRGMASVLVVACGALAGAQAPAPGAKPASPPAAAGQAAPPQAPKPQGAPAPSAQAPAVSPAPRPAPPSAARVAAAIMVTDQSGTSLPDVHVTLTGPVDREGTTGRDGVFRVQALKPGTYRVRFESPDFITFEREVIVKAGATAEVDAALNRVPAKPVEPPPPPPAQPASLGAGPAPDPGASAALVDLLTWIERNPLKGEPSKEAVVGKSPTSTATVLQVREPLKDRVHADMDEMFYVIAGTGVLHSKGHDLSLDAGALVVVPRGVACSLERRGRNPLTILSVLSR